MIRDRLIDASQLTGGNEFPFNRFNVNCESIPKGSCFVESTHGSLLSAALVRV